jgi:hypothetical protein
MLITKFRLVKDVVLSIELQLFGIGYLYINNYDEEHAANDTNKDYCPQRAL